MAKKNPLKILQNEVSEIQQQLNKSEIKCCLAWYSKNEKTGKPKLECKTDSHGNKWPTDIKAKYTMKVDFQWIDAVKPNRYILLDSGRGAGKSWTIASILLARSSDAPIRILSTREVQNSLKESAYALFKVLIERYSLPFILMEKEIRGENGSLISFCGIRDHTVESIKSYEGYHLAWSEEFQTITERSFEILEPTIRTKGSQIFLSMNRRYRNDYAQIEFIDNPEPPAGLLHIQGSYLENPFLAPDFLQRAADMKVKKTEVYAHVYGGGLRLKSDSLILNFEIAESSERFEEQLEAAHKIVTNSAMYFGRRLSGLSIDERKRVIYEKIHKMNLNGMDWSNGGKMGINAGIKLFLDDQRKLIFIKDEIYNNAEIQHLPRMLLSWSDDWRYVRIQADSVNPAMIKLCRQYGMKGMIGVNKKVNLSEQLQALQMYQIIIHPECTNFIDECARYEWSVDSAGFATDRPAKSPDHSLDAMRYSLVDQLSKDIRNISGGYQPLPLTTI